MKPKNSCLNSKELRLKVQGDFCVNCPSPSPFYISCPIPEKTQNKTKSKEKPLRVPVLVFLLADAVYKVALAVAVADIAI